MCVAVAYDRVSTSRQAKEGVMLEARDDAIRRYIEFKGWELFAYHTDPGRSGRTGKYRPGYDRAMLDACQPGRVLIGANINRMFRSTIDAANCLRKLQDAGANIVLVELGVDATTAAGKLIYSIMADIAEFESNQIGERVKAANRHIVKTRGFRTMGVKKFGWRYDRTLGQLVEHPEQQEIIRQVREHATVCTSLKELCADLETLGIPAPKGNRWHRNFVARIAGDALKTSPPVACTPATGPGPGQ